MKTETKEEKFELFAGNTYRVRQFAVRCVQEVAVPVEPHCSSAEAAVDFWSEVITRADWFDPEKECICVLCLDQRKKIKGWNFVSLGSSAASIGDPVQVLRAVIIASAARFILMHNHPSGDPAPSTADVQVTHKIRAGAEAVSVDFLDHVIVGRAAADPLGRGFYSFRAAGLL